MGITRGEVEARRVIINHMIDAETRPGAPSPEQDFTLTIDAVAALYERALVLVRPDGHVAWRSDQLPADPLALADRVRGADAAGFDAMAKCEAELVGN